MYVIPIQFFCCSCPVQFHLPTHSLKVSLKLYRAGLMIIPIHLVQPCFNLEQTVRLQLQDSKGINFTPYLVSLYILFLRGVPSFLREIISREVVHCLLQELDQYSLLTHLFWWKYKGCQSTLYLFRTVQILSYCCSGHTCL